MDFLTKSSFKNGMNLNPIRTIFIFWMKFKILKGRNTSNIGSRSSSWTELTELHQLCFAEFPIIELVEANTTPLTNTIVDITVIFELPNLSVHISLEYGLPPSHFQVSSTSHLLFHPSPPLVLWSSHISSPALSPSPQTVTHSIGFEAVSPL